MKIKNLTEGLNAQQQSVPQLPAMFRPKKISVLNNPTDPRHPMTGYAVGANESIRSKDPYDQGWRTGLRPGQDETACPYKPGTAEHAQWMAGYEEARAQRDHYKEGVAEGGQKQLTVQQLATISDEALDNAYHYGRSTPGNTFGWQANLKSAAYAKQMIDRGVTDIEAISDAIHKGWNVTARAFVQNPEQFADTEKLRAAGKLEAKLQQRAKLMNIGYAQLPDEEQEKDRVVARALLQALKGPQGVAEGRAGVDDTDTVGFSVNSEAAYTAVMKRFGDVIDHDETSGVMYAPADVWPQIEMTAFDADPDSGAVRVEDDMMEAKRNEMNTPEFQRALASVKKQAAQGPMKTVYDPKTRKYRVVPVAKQNSARDAVKESADNITKEDIITKLKARLGDYLSDISKEIKKDPDLVDKLSAKAPGDQMGPPVKTVTTDDGHEIQIHGNEDDGFRISIKNRPAKTKFKNLDEAVMACEIYCARQRNKNSDYLDEA
jgi:ribosome modulation factor